MKQLIAAEFKKLSTTRTPYLVLGGVVAMAMMSVIDPDHSAATFEKPFHEQTFVFFTSLLTRILILVLGIRAITDEFRHGTIVPTLLATPKRSRVLAAKLLAVAAVGAILGLVAWGAMTAAAAAIATSDGTNLTLGSDAWRSLAGMTGAGAVWAAIGVGVGTIIRNQIAATVGGLIWLMGIEDAIRGWFGDLASYLPGQAGLMLAIAPTPRAAWIGAGTLMTYVVFLGFASTWTFRRDVT